MLDVQLVHRSVARRIIDNATGRGTNTSYISGWLTTRDQLQLRAVLPVVEVKAAM